MCLNSTVVDFNETNSEFQQNEAVDYTYSFKTIALAVSSVALIAIGLSALALVFSLGIPGLGMGAAALILIGISGTVGGVALGGAIPCIHTREVARREFDFASIQTDIDRKIEYLGKAAEKDFSFASEEMHFGENLLLTSFDIGDEKLRNAQYEKGLKAIESAILHTIKPHTLWFTPEKYLLKMNSLHSWLKKMHTDTFDQLNTEKYQSNHLKATKAKKSFQKAMVKYANSVAQGSVSWG